MGDDHRISLVQLAENLIGTLGCRHDRAVAVEGAAVIQKTNFQNGPRPR